MSLLLNQHFQSSMVTLAIASAARRSHLPVRRFKSTSTRPAAAFVPRWILAVSRPIAWSSFSSSFVLGSDPSSIRLQSGARRRISQCLLTATKGSGTRTA